MPPAVEKPIKVGTEITVRISLTFQESPDVHTLLATTPVRERGKLVRLALERYIKETAHPAGDVEQQISAISAWLRSRATAHGVGLGNVQPPAAAPNPGQHIARSPKKEILQTPDPNALQNTLTSAGASPSINRWLQT